VVNTVYSYQDDSSSTTSKNDFSSPDEYAFTVVSHLSEALSVTSDLDIWFGDIGATEHITDRRSWFSTFNPILEGSWHVSIANNHKLSVLSRGTIRILHQMSKNDSL